MFSTLNTTCEILAVVTDVLGGLVGITAGLKHVRERRRHPFRGKMDAGVVCPQLRQLRDRLDVRTEQSLHDLEEALDPPHIEMNVVDTERADGHVAFSVEGVRCV
ncbi:MAG: hypothetical protein IPM40_01615 [Gammaproteobacteria bacterium]|nr:hypothetical protein [Gammaproteobacteria bacterium]